MTRRTNAPEACTGENFSMVEVCGRFCIYSWDWWQELGFVEQGAELVT